MTPLFSTSPLILGIIEDVEMSLIKPFRFNYRYLTGDISGLSHSIKEKGLLQPILIRNSNTDSRYEIIAGHRRYEACKKLGWRKIICHIVELDDRASFEISIIENVHRRSLNPIEEADAYKKYVLKFGWGGISDLAEKIGKSVSYIDKRIRLLELPTEIVNSLSVCSVSPSAAEELLSMKDKKKQSELANLALNNKISSRGIREMIKGIKRDEIYDYDDSQNRLNRGKMKNIDEATQRSFDKSIIAMRSAMTKISAIIEEIDDDWIAYEALMQHKNMLHNQIDLLIREKMKIRANFSAPKIF
jgi:ParB family chromosome partitioning protein